MNGLKRRVHFVGVGGIGMSGLAEILLNLGYDVSGSDLKATEITDRLAAYGLRFYEGHAASNIGDAGIVVVSAAVKSDNAEVTAARERGTLVIHRSDMLADLMRLKPNAVAVGGTHGKTTTTSMISAFLDRANIGATSIVGGILHRSGTNARWGTGDYLVAEADEHDGSFLRLHPTISVVTSIDAEHLEYYGTLDGIQRAFVDFCNRIPFYGYSIVCWDEPNIRAVIPEIESVCIPYGIEDGAAVRGSNIQLAVPDPSRPKAAQLSHLRTRFDVEVHDERLGLTGRMGTLEVNAIGTHNVRNALGACTVGLCLGMRFGMIADGLKLFDGVQRRLQVRGEARGVLVVEDYAHHPTEIASTLEAVRWAEPKRIVAVFQPHLYSRTKFFRDDFARVLASVDRAIVTDIYPSREEPMPGVDSSIVVEAAREQGAAHVSLIRDMYAVPAQIAPDLEPGDIVLVLGAGNINRIAEPLLQELART
ncbi:MAG TPA: UDP-N-acetylmuramate--L-alanine ligase [Candidatus Hydrogenedentes bacterium]|nr:UDP-N-acetylmuramate--L-alanine ligase [Candidatus Hydrogenedentota bacterium]HOV75774.1 UDP-N-acetylmuramate--L-alanine ligase [Candidatus Hydrogenedentota bacterium]HPC17349.1 UDP-N-acetylmuramate--L-alanine ligase [Candidatus Hydrogenedentota bacterium]HRT20083.1 UDP-N-acetylmuramate--L-alanine ligase [Candidatus Hydrogenedentota bacterium]HRT64853.1 UDP-N-acetylmuramate--L-alanine ligase [Candidatus Hydrogenedentota bacterium]